MAAANLHQIIDAIIEELFKPDTRRLANWIDQLCNRNQEISRETCNGFIYGGVFYRRSTVEGMIPNKRSIHSSLGGDMDIYCRDQSLMLNDKAFIRQGLFMVLEPCQTDQDIRDALPECLIPCCSGNLGYLPRQNEACFTIKDNPRAARQFAKIFPTMEIYAAARLIF